MRDREAVEELAGLCDRIADALETADAETLCEADRAGVLDDLESILTAIAGFFEPDGEEVDEEEAGQ